MSNSSALRIKGSDLPWGMRVFPCNRKGEPLGQRTIYRVLYAPNSRQLALYHDGSSHIETLFGLGMILDKEAWFAPAESFSLQDFSRGTGDTRVVVFLNEGLLRDPVDQEEVLELVARTNGNGTKFLAQTGEEYPLPKGAILIPMGKIG